MSTNFPTTLDDATSLPVEASGTALSVNHVTAHQNLQDAVEAIEAKLGVNGSAVTTSHDYKLSGVTGTDKAVSKTGTETLTNKTLTSPTVTGATITTSTVNGVTLQTAGSATDFLGADGSYHAGSTSNASTSVKGVVEAATSSEVTAGTATGGTGAVLVVTPDALAASTPVFNGSALTNLPGQLIGLSATDSSSVTNTVAETTVATISIPANTIGTTKGVKFRATFYASWTASNGDITFRAKYGGTSICDSTITSVSGTPTQSGYFVLDGILISAGTTSSQEGTAFMESQTLSSGTITKVTTPTSLSIDNTSSQNLIFTIQWSSASSSLTSKLVNYVIEKLY